MRFTNAGACVSAFGDPCPDPTTGEFKASGSPRFCGVLPVLPNVGEITPMIEFEVEDVRRGMYGLGGGFCCSPMGLVGPLLLANMGLEMDGEPTEGGGGDRGAFSSAPSISSPRRGSTPKSSWIGRGGGRSTMASSN